jgi:hypothetical protein
VLGLNGFSRMSEGEFSFVLEMREGLIRESGATLGEAIPLNSAVEFVRKHFKNVSDHYFLTSFRTHHLSLEY